MQTQSTIDPSAFAIRYRNPDGTIGTLYEPTLIQTEFHSRQEPNVWIFGSRGTGKSVALRNEAHARALAYPKFTYAIVRKTMDQLRKSHLKFIDDEMRSLGGRFNKTESVAYYPNGSQGFYTYVGDEKELGNLLSAEFCWLGIDEAPTIPWATIRMIAGSVRVPKASGLTALVRYGGNPIGESSQKLRQYCIDKNVDPNDDPDYVPGEWHAVFTKLTDNPHIDEVQYRKQFAGLPPHVRKAWLNGEFVVEGAYFEIDTERHFITSYPQLRGALIYRAMDWGFFPDPAVCLWIAVFPNGRAVVFKEKAWTRTTAREVALDIKRESEGMRVIESFCDPSMFDGSQATGSSVGDIFESNGVPLTKSRNDRTAAGYAISEWLCTSLVDDGLPKLQVFAYSCPMLAKTLPEMRVDPKHPGRLADGNDHYVISLAYFCMAATASPRIITPRGTDFLAGGSPINRPRLYPGSTSVTRRRLGSESIRRSR